jgi:hypothetical protein
VGQAAISKINCGALSLTFRFTTTSGLLIAWLIMIPIIAIPLSWRSAKRQQKSKALAKRRMPVPSPRRAQRREKVVPPQAVCAPSATDLTGNSCDGVNVYFLGFVNWLT